MWTLSNVKTIFGCDLRSLALFRVCLGSLLIVDLLLRARDFRAHYTDFGIIPLDALVDVFGKSSLWPHVMNASPLAQALLFFTAGGVAFCLLVGYRTWLATFLSWVLLMSLHSRNEFILQGGDQFLRMLLFWGMFLPLGARFSVDAARDPEHSAHASDQYFSMASMALWLQVMSLYFFSALLKSDRVWIPDGTATSYALHIDYMVTPFGVWMRQFPELLQGLTYYVWALELVGPILIFSPLFHTQIRLLLLFLLVTMHVGFMSCMNLGLFPFINFAALFALMPNVVWDRLGRWINTPERLGLRIYYDGDCGFCKSTCLLLRMFLLPREAVIAPAQTDPEMNAILEAQTTWIVVDYDGTRYLRWDALALVFRRSFFFWPLGWFFALGPIRRIGEAFYTWVAANRFRLSRVIRVLLPEKRQVIQPDLPVNSVVGALMGFVLYLNFVSLPQFPHGVWNPLEQVGWKLNLGQNWNMFAPHPAKIHGWYVVVGQLGDGIPVDVLNEALGESSWEKPRYIGRMYSSYRWRKYLNRIPHADDRDHRPYYGVYLCRKWNEGKSEEFTMSSIELYYLTEETRLDGTEPPRERMLIWKQKCGAKPVPFDSIVK